MSNKDEQQEIIRWENVKRESTNSNYDLSWLDNKKGTSLAKLDGTNKLAIKEKFLKDLDKQIQDGRNINEYRELKTFLVEQANYINKQTTLNSSDLQKYIDKLDDLIFKTNTERYEEAKKLLSDEESFKQLEEMQKEYHKTLDSLALETAVEKQNKLTSAKVSLLEILRGENDG